MRRLIQVSALVLAVFFVVSCSHEQPAAPESQNLIESTSLFDQQITSEIFNLTQWPIDSPENLPDPDPDKFFNWIVGYERT